MTYVCIHTYTSMVLDEECEEKYGILNRDLILAKAIQNICEFQMNVPIIFPSKFTIKNSG